MKKTLPFITFLLLLATTTHSQTHKCAAELNWQKLAQDDPDAELRRKQLELRTQQWIEYNAGNERAGTLITIPVVVHVVYNTSTENISDAQVISQIDALNEDFRLTNADQLQQSHPFYSAQADSRIEFCLAQRDPNGNPTNGITRTFTNTTSFSGNGDEKNNSTGGKDNWDPTKYMNMWVVNLGDGGFLGYATFPSDLSQYPAEDGIVINYKAFGTTGTAGTPPYDNNDYGRTGTHEVGHWLNLRHTWGDAMCGDDMVSDTPPQEQSNSNCPTFPQNPNNPCGAGANGEMYMNYMDYVDDYCMVMFTTGQKNRMTTALNGPRSGLLGSQGCSPAISSIDETDITIEGVSLFPNPSTGQFTIGIQTYKPTTIDITITNVLGKTVYQHSQQKIVGTEQLEIDLNHVASGTYFVSIFSEHQTINKRFIIND